MNINLPSGQNNLFSDFFNFYVPIMGWLAIILLLIFSVLFG